jgi:phosphoenolpyruvate synthase/pyruvate phosphate dikinase
LGLITPDNAMAEKGESIMFQPRELPFVEAPRENDDEAGKCAELAKRIESLKGKPQRRHAALERYRLMCTDKALTE